MWDDFEKVRVVIIGIFLVQIRMPYKSVQGIYSYEFTTRSNRTLVQSYRKKTDAETETEKDFWNSNKSWKIITTHYYNCFLWLLAHPSIWMSHWRCWTTKGAEFWITCKGLAFLSSFSCLQVIQNKHPWCWAAAYVTAGWSGKIFKFKTDLHYGNQLMTRLRDSLCPLIVSAVYSGGAGNLGVQKWGEAWFLLIGV